jgi:hypothetical protein
MPLFKTVAEIVPRVGDAALSRLARSRRFVEECSAGPPAEA